MPRKFDGVSTLLIKLGHREPKPLTEGTMQSSLPIGSAFIIAFDQRTFETRLPPTRKRFCTDPYTSEGRQW
jgi:hypothetical protein